MGSTFNPNDLTFREKRKTREKKNFSEVSTVKNSQNENLPEFTITSNRNKNLDLANAGFGYI